MRLGNQAAILAVSRLTNFGLLLLGPLVLVRLLSVEDFGRYREFMLYASLLISIASFSFPDGLLYFIPSHPQSPSRVVWQTITLTAISTVIVVVAFAAADLIMHRTLAGAYLLPLVLYTLLLVNFDFWEFYLIATRRSALVLLYSGVRLTGRMLVTVISAALSHDINTIIWSLIGFEGVRVLVSALIWRRLDQSAAEPELPEGVRAQLRFCVPTGLTMILALLRRNLSTLAVARLLGPVPLAHFAIGRYAEPVVTVLRNSLTAVILPEMVRREGKQAHSALALWKRATTINCIILFPVAVIIARFAEPAIEVAFGPAYRPAAIVMQLYMLVMIRECFDFSPLLRSAGRTAGLVYANVVGLAAGALSLWWLIPRFGLPGAMGSYVIASYVEVTGLLIAACITNHIGPRQAVPWWSVARVALAGGLASPVILQGFWTETLGFAGIVLAAACYFAVYALLLALLKVVEALTLVVWARRLFFARAAIGSN